MAIDSEKLCFVTGSSDLLPFDVACWVVNMSRKRLVLGLCLHWPALLLPVHSAAALSAQDIEFSMMAQTSCPSCLSMLEAKLRDLGGVM